MQNRIMLLLAAAMLVVAAGTLVGAGTQAFFTDTATSIGNVFSTGTVSIQLTDSDEGPAASVSSSISFSNMIPGDAVTGSVLVTNGGSLALRYAVNSTTTEDTLAAQLDLTIKTIDVTTPGTPCDNFDGTILYGSADLGSTITGIKVIGDLATDLGRYLSGSSQNVDTDGSFPSDGAPAVAPTSETLCLRVVLPSITGNAYQGLSTTATFTFDAEQRANNP